MSEVNVYFIIPDLKKGGGERVTCEIIKALTKKGFDVFIYTNNSEPLGESSANIKFFKLQWNRRLATLFTLFKMLYFSPKNSKIIPVLTGPIILIGMLNIIFRRQVIAYEHSDIEALYFNVSNSKKYIRMFLFWIALHGVSKLVVVSNYIKYRICAILNYDKNKVFVAKNPFIGFLKKISRAQLVQKSCSEEPIFTAYIIGRFSQEKRITEAVEFAAISSGVDRIVVVTDVTYSLINQLSNHAVSKIKVLSSFDEISDFNPSASMLINFSKVESFSLVIAEWLASDLLVFTVQTTNLFELWSDYNGCFFIDESKPLSKNIIQESLNQKNILQKETLKEVNIEESIQSLLGRHKNAN